MKIKNKNNLIFGILLMGGTGLSAGWGGRLYLVIICFGVLLVC
jgi:hypothetical protein